MRLYMRNATLIDGTGAPAREGAALLIEGDTVVHAGPLAVTDAPSAGAAQIVDLAGRTVIPGLVEAHIHLSNSNVKVIADLDLNCPPEYSTLVSAKNAELALHCGYTAARSAGSVHAVDVARKRAITEGLYPGPRLLAASRDIVATGGMSDWNPSYLKLGMEGLAMIADGPDARGEISDSPGTPTASTPRTLRSSWPSSASRPSRPSARPPDGGRS